MPYQELDFSYSISDALCCFANEEHLALLDSNEQGGSVLTWGQAPQLCASLDAINVSHGIANKSSSSWPLNIHQGTIIQMDYEFPVGPWAAQSSHPGQARLWTLQNYLRWDNKTCFVHAADKSTLENIITYLKTKHELENTIQLRKPLRSQLSFAEYQQCIDTIHAYIAQGDIYQVNFTMPFYGELEDKAHQDIITYLQLRHHSPAPYSAFFRMGSQSIISHSPECFLSVFDKQCHSHPIKGTRKRVPGSEQAIREELRLAEKDKAELDMIIDLVRNDLGRIAKPGSVSVSNKRQIMDLPYVHHALGHIECTFAENKNHADIFSACFPPGSITGAPKIRAMQIINELEQRARGAYCGCFGWLGEDAQCELAVGIRTMQIQGQHVRIDAGGGIVSDSNAADEWQELNDKASAMRKIVEGSPCVS